MRRLLPILLFVMLPIARAEAVTLRDIVDLTRAGLGEEVLLALIEVDGGVFTIDTATLTMLKREGVSERVILALVRSGRMRPADEPVAPVAEVVQAPEPPPVVVVEHYEREVPVAVPVPVYVPVYPRRNRFADGHHPQGYPATRLPEERKRAEPVYWGFGGKLRPDAWQPATRNSPSRPNRPENHRER